MLISCSSLDVRATLLAVGYAQLEWACVAVLRVKLRLPHSALGEGIYSSLLLLFFTLYLHTRLHTDNLFAFVFCQYRRTVRTCHHLHRHQLHRLPFFLSPSSVTASVCLAALGKQ